MYLQSLKITQFKNYESQLLTFSPQLNCIVGRNGMGKTNLLDAVYYLCMCKSALGLRDAGLVNHAYDFFRLEGLFQKTEKQYKIVAKVIPRKRKEIECNGTAYSRMVDHIGLLPVVMIVPDDTRLATEGSEERRRFLDNTLSQLDQSYLSALVKYNRILKQRNAALKQMGQERRYDAALLSTYDQQLEGPAKLIFEKRNSFQSTFRDLLQQYYNKISGGQEEVDCIYKSQLLENSFGQLMQEAAEKDRILQRTTSGIHRDDLQFKIGGHPLKKFASQGQLKSYVLALKLAQYEVLKKDKKEPPLLLLDDIFDKLDRHRVKFLIQLILENEFGQVFITDTEMERLETILSDFALDYCKFVVEKGQVDQIEEH